VTLKWQPVPTLLFALIAAVAASMTMAETTYYRWVDDRGNPVHSDRPPPTGTEYEVITSGTNLVRRVQNDVSPAPSDNNRSAAAPQPDRQELEVISKDPAVCKQATGNLETLLSSARIRLRNAEGEYEFLSEDEKQEQIEKARDLISVHCE